jgi:penicillin-insensitive murein endopeptidase
MSERREMSSFPPSGTGFVTYSTLLAAFGRQYVRRAVRLTIQDAFAERYQADPRRAFVLGETGLSGGGKLWPHASHAGGMSVDIFLPLMDAERAPIRLSHEPWNLWGYCHHFDDAGRYAGTRWEAKPRRVPMLGEVSPCPARNEASRPIQVDFDETARLLASIARTARLHGLEIRVVIITPEYLSQILGSAVGRELGAFASKFVRRPVWIRHDEHVHIEFSVLK